MKLMIKKLLSAAGLLVALQPDSALADWTQDFIRIACIPDARFFKIEYSPMNGGDAFVVTNDKETIRDRFKAWRAGGFFDPSNLKYECKLPQTIYQVIATQPPASERGLCGGAPRITLSVKENGTPLLTNVTFGYDCFNGPSVFSLTVFETVSGYGNGGTKMCVSPAGEMPSSYSGNSGPQEQCGYLRSSDEIIQGKLAEFLKMNARK